MSDFRSSPAYPRYRKLLARYREAGELNWNIPKAWMDKLNAGKVDWDWIRDQATAQRDAALYAVREYCAQCDADWEIVDRDIQFEMKRYEYSQRLIAFVQNSPFTTDINAMSRTLGSELEVLCDASGQDRDELDGFLYRVDEYLSSIYPK